MARKFIYPSSKQSVTAVKGKADFRDDNLYSAGVVAHGATGRLQMFTSPQGASIPEIKGASPLTATTQAHQVTYTNLTTNLQKAGELGTNIGDAAVNAIGLYFEQAYYTQNSGAFNTSFGMVDQDVKDVLSKTAFFLEIASKQYIKGPSFLFPAMGGGSYGSISNTNTSSIAAVVQNGNMPLGRRLRVPILIGRNDTVVGTLEVAGAASLAFSTTTGSGQPSLVWVTMHCDIKGDVR